MHWINPVTDLIYALQLLHFGYVGGVVPPYVPFEPTSL